MTARARFYLKMDAAEKDIVSRAAAVMHTTMTGFVRAAAVERAIAVLERDSRVTLSKRDFAPFTKALNRAFTPNRALSGALAKARSKVRRA
jgi:uncharacterized protein (DUF1778 family)